MEEVVGIPGPASAVPSSPSSGDPREGPWDGVVSRKFGQSCRNCVCNVDGWCGAAGTKYRISSFVEKWCGLWERYRP